MKRYKLAVVGSGMGGTLIAALNRYEDIILFEKDGNLGGCATTFKRYGCFYNAGATTLVGYEENHPLKKIFDTLSFTPSLIKTSPSICIMQKGQQILRNEDFESFLAQVESVYPHKNNRIFWEKMYRLDQKFWKLKHLYYAKYSLKGAFKTLLCLFELLWVFRGDLFKTAKGYTKKYLKGISSEYEDFINAQLLITVQTTMDKLPLLSMALGLSYPFHPTFYVKDGMGKLFEELLANQNVQKREEILSIKKQEGYFEILTNKGQYESEKVVLNNTVFDASDLFEDSSIKSYYNQFTFHDQSAFVLYLKIDTTHTFLSHYQVILDTLIPNCVSKSFFVSFALGEDRLCQRGLSVTVSTHSKASMWKNVSKEAYTYQKLLTKQFILEAFFEHFPMIEQEQITQLHSATSSTFNSYISRYNCGGKPFTLSSVFQIPSCDTPFEGLYHVGDTVFAGQGWPGVALGATILNKELNGNC